LTLVPGDAVPSDLAVVDRRGERLAVSSFRGEAALLIYLRHLG
jgi:hypothetical protein